MDVLRTLWLFLLLSQLPLRPTDADPSTDPSTDPMFSSEPDGGGSLTTTAEARLTTTDHRNFTNNTDGSCAGCLIDTEMGLIAVGSAGGLIVCLLVAVVVLAWQVWHLQRRIQIPRTSRSNMDLVSSTGYWGADRQEMGGLVGPCDSSVILEEVRADSRKEEESRAELEAMEEAGPLLGEGGEAMGFDPEENAEPMQSSSSRDSCSEIPRDLENMPLVV
ncbi:uncharacterized protein [Embiotoca jacksoni]|uniref:uncharacterized protein n=1 Tax=Embiotoca jacksoni TaxID=100190 RepID=UPI0037043B14